jgi:pyridoxamine 5'-phosphate oxidase family protein
MTNTIFSQKEMKYIKSQRLARIATAASSKEKVQGVDTSIQPDVVPVGFDFNGDYFYVGRMNILRSTKYKNVLRHSARA